MLAVLKVRPHQHRVQQECKVKKTLCMPSQRLPSWIKRIRLKQDSITHIIFYFHIHFSADPCLLFGPAPVCHLLLLHQNKEGCSHWRMLSSSGAFPDPSFKAGNKLPGIVLRGRRKYNY